MHKAFFVIVAILLPSSSAVNFALFEKPLLPQVITYVVGLAAVGAAMNDSKISQVIGVFMFLMFIAFQMTDELV